MTGLSENLVGMTGLSEHKGREEELSEPLVRDEGIKEPYWVSTVMFVGLNKNKFIITVLHGLPLFLSYQFSTLFTILMRMFLLVHQPVVVRPSVLSLRCCDSFSR